MSDTKFVKTVTGKLFAVDEGRWADQCPHCGGLGYTVYQNYANPPEQELCRLCDGYGIIDWVTKMMLGMK